MRALVWFLALLSLLASAASAGVEITLTTGYRVGTAAFPVEASGPLILCVTTPCVLAEARTDDGNFTPSLIVDVPLTGSWMLEVLWTQLDDDLELRSGFPPEMLEPETFESTTLLVGVLRQWGDKRLRPFVAGGLGFTRFESSAMAYERPLFPGIVAVRVDEEGLAGSLAAGVKADLTERFAARLELRGYWHDLPDLVGGTLDQQEASLGLTVRW